MFFVLWNSRLEVLKSCSEKLGKILKKAPVINLGLIITQPNPDILQNADGIFYFQRDIVGTAGCRVIPGGVEK